MIQQIRVDQSFVCAVPSREPYFDTEWLSPGASEIRFFRDSRRFQSIERGEKMFGRDTNMYSPYLMPKGEELRLERVVIYPATHGVVTVPSKYRMDVEEFRQSAEFSLCVGGGRRLFVSALRDVCANVPFHDFHNEVEHGPVEEGFDPTEAPELSFRRGLDVRIGGLPYAISQQEDLYAVVRGDAVKREIGFHCYLVGTRLRSIQG